MLNKFHQKVAIWCRAKKMLKLAFSKKNRLLGLRFLFRHFFYCTLEKRFVLANKMKLVYLILKFFFCSSFFCNFWVKVCLREWSRMQYLLLPALILISALIFLLFGETVFRRLESIAIYESAKRKNYRKVATWTLPKKRRN